MRNTLDMNVNSLTGHQGLQEVRTVASNKVRTGYADWRCVKDATMQIKLLRARSMLTRVIKGLFFFKVVLYVICVIILLNPK